MLDNVVLDSCIIAAIFFPETISERAIEIVENHDCTTVDLAYIEVANVAWKRVRHSGPDPDIVRSVCQFSGIYPGNLPCGAGS